MKQYDQNRVLFLTNQNPAGTGGGHAAIRAYLKALRALMPRAVFDICLYDVFRDDMKSFALEGQNNYHYAGQRSLATRLVTPFTGTMHRFQKLALDLMRRNRYDMVVFGSSEIGGTLVSSVPQGTVSVTLNHNYEPEYFIWEDVSPLYRRVFLPHVKRLERKAYKKSTLSLFLTEEDKTKFLEVYGPTESLTFVTGYFSDSADRPSPAEIKNNGGRLVITGSLDNPQNIDGIKYFFNELYPLVPPGTDIVIAGKNPSAEVRRLCSAAEGVTLLANPVDMSDIVRLASVFLCVTRVGGGMKIRLTDGLACGVPVVTHAVSARGYGAFKRAGALLDFTTPEEFAEALRNLQPAVALGTITPSFIRSIYERELSFSAGVARLSAALESV